MGYKDFVASQEAQGGGAWSHPLYSRAHLARGAGPLSLAKTVLKGALSLGKGALRRMKPTLARTIVDMGSDILLKRRNPKAVAKQMIKRRGKFLVSKGLANLKKELFTTDALNRRKKPVKRNKGKKRVGGKKGRGRQRGGSSVKNKKQTTRSKSNQRSLIYKAGLV